MACCTPPLKKQENKGKMPLPILSLILKSFWRLDFTLTLSALLTVAISVFLYIYYHILCVCTIPTCIR